ncbi:peptidase [Gracilibacillus oryzae]|uniref:Peptidase n=1 Tax=Gracilibacillus oryzae TaxID=1672701 RepID=A0A7C8KSN7_9BACI|nr:peptidase [Gracilibacillus oryzae]KAB8129163.1 peptidase [Gracilibacillus oryzae]
MISHNSNITLYPLTIRQDKKHYIVEDKTSGEFFEMPKICIDAIELINDKVPLEEIEKTLQAKYPEEEVDILEFAEQLLDFGLVKEIDGEEVKQEKSNAAAQGFSWLPANVGRFFFHRGTKIILFLVILMNIFYMIMKPDFFPNYQDIFVFDSIVLSVLFYMFISLFLILIHEFGHILAIRAHNLPTKLEVGHRLYLLVVFETDMTAGWKLKPKERNLLYLGGIYFDQWIVAIVLTLKFFLPIDGTFVDAVLSLIVLDIFIKTIYQCCFYMKTDLYYLFENITGCYNIMENSQRLFSRWLPFVKTDNKTEAYEEEKVYVRLYAVFYVLGISVTLALFAFYMVPQFFFVFSRLIPALISPSGNPYFWDAVVFLLQLLIMIGLLLYTWTKSHSNKE